MALAYAALHVAGSVVAASWRARARVESDAGALWLRGVRTRHRALVGVRRRRASGGGAVARAASSRALLGVYLLLRRRDARRPDRLVDARRRRRGRDRAPPDAAGAP